MAKVFDAEEVAQHASAESCWVVLYGHVYDVTDFVPSHPGGAQAILRLAGTDCTADFDPVHPPGTLDELKPEAKLGAVDPASVARLAAKRAGGGSGGSGGSGGGGGNNGNNGSSGGSSSDDGGAAGAGAVVPYKAPPLETLLSLDEIEAVATKLVSDKCWAYYYSAGDDLQSKRHNTAAFRQVLLRPRVFVDCTACDLRTRILGGRETIGLPVYAAPAAMARLAHADGEAGIARGLAGFGGMQIVSHNASMTVEQVVADAAPGQVFGWQIYVQKDRRRSEAMLARVERLKAHFRFVVLTLDAPVAGKREDDERAQFGPAGSAAAAAVVAPTQAGAAPKPGPAGGIGQQMFWGTAADLTWQTTLPWLRQHTSLPIVLKGVQTHEDAWLAAQYAAAHPGSVAGIILSNHGGRALDTAPPALHTLLEIRRHCPQVFAHVDVWLDGGVKRGTDVVKALCLGAKAVGVGRAPLWGLGAGGWQGVERTFAILADEIARCMRLLGARTVADLHPRLVNARALERDIFAGDAGLETLAETLAKL